MIGVYAVFTPERQTKTLLTLLKFDDLSVAKEQDPDSQPDGLGLSAKGITRWRRRWWWIWMSALLHAWRSVGQPLGESDRLLRDARMKQLKQESMYDDGCVGD